MRYSNQKVRLVLKTIEENRFLHPDVTEFGEFGHGLV